MAVRAHRAACWLGGLMLESRLRGSLRHLDRLWLEAQRRLGAQQQPGAEK
jgi:hypothetical protein